MTAPDPWSKPEVHTVEHPGASATTSPPPAETEEGD